MILEIKDLRKFSEISLELLNKLVPAKKKRIHAAHTNFAVKNYRKH